MLNCDGEIILIGGNQTLGLSLGSEDNINIPKDDELEQIFSYGRNKWILNHEDMTLELIDSVNDKRFLGYNRNYGLSLVNHQSN